MRKIRCQTCKPRNDGRILEGASYVIFDSLMICDTCRLAAIEWMLLMGFNFSHPFIAELSNMENRKEN